jgi:hypothetical protein
MARYPDEPEAPLPSQGLSKEDAQFVLRGVFRLSERAQRDLDTFFEMVIRHEHTKAPLKTAPHQSVLFSFIQAHPFAVIRMPAGTTKCVDADTLMVDPITGLRVRARDAVDNLTHLFTWDEQRGIHPAPITQSYDLGTKRCLEFVFRSGRKLAVTPEHKMLTPGGWIEAAGLVPGDTIAAAGSIPSPEVPVDLDPSVVDLLALLLSEGCTTVRASFSTADQYILKLARRAAHGIGCQVVHRNNYDYTIICPEHPGNPAHDLCRRFGLWGKKSTEKRIPDDVFRLPPASLARFISIFWQCDGYVDRIAPVIALANKEMIQQIAHLLLRFGVRSTVKEAPNEHAGAWRLVVRSDSFEAFRRAFSLRGHKLKRLEKICGRKHNATVGNPALRPDVIHSVRRYVDTLPRRCIDAGNRKRTLKELLFTRKKISDRPTSASRAGFAKFFEAHPSALNDFGWWFADSVDWDELLEVRDAGERHVFDFTMDPTACFVANDLIAHNTFSVAAMALFATGNDVTQRGAVVSRTQKQARKVLKMVKNYIEDPSLSAALRIVFPHLARSRRPGDAWTQNEITVDRKGAIRDATVRAAGIDAKDILGSRLSWFVADDLLDLTNTQTPAAQEDTASKFISNLVTRLDPKVGRAVVCNHPWSRGDLTYFLEETAGWATLTMDIKGYIRFSNANASWIQSALDTHLRPSTTRGGSQYDWYRLTAHDPDPEELVPLWPDHFSASEIKRMQAGGLPHEFARVYMCDPFDESAARCQRGWIELCKRAGMKTRMVSRYDGDNPTYTGLDLAIGRKERHDKSVFFTFEQLPDKRRILDIESGRWTGPEILDRIVQKTTAYKSMLGVETNAAQDFIRQFALDRKADLLVKAHTTTRSNKQHIEFGVESIFAEMQNGAWIIPCDVDGRCHEEIQAWIDQMLYYQPPPAHTGDSLIACWIARETSRRGRGSGTKPVLGMRRHGVNMGGF